MKSKLQQTFDTVGQVLNHYDSIMNLFADNQDKEEWPASEWAEVCRFRTLMIGVISFYQLPIEVKGRNADAILWDLDNWHDKLLEEAVWSDKYNQFMVA